MCVLSSWLIVFLYFFFQENAYILTEVRQLTNTPNFVFATKEIIVKQHYLQI